MLQKINRHEKKIEVNNVPNIFTISVGREGVNIDHYNSLLLFSLFIVGGGVLWEIVPNSLYSLLFFLKASLTKSVLRSQKSEFFQISIEFPWKCSVTDLNVCMLRKSNKHPWTCQTVFKYWDHQFTLSSPRLRLLHSSTSFIDTVCILKFPLLFTDLKWIWQEDKWDLNGETSVQKIYYVGEVMSSSRGCNNLEETAFFNQLYCCQTRTKIVALF